MNDEKERVEYLSFKQIINEALIRDLILFSLLYLFSLNLPWKDPLLLMFPLIMYCFSLFFRILSSNKWRVLNKSRNLIVFNPFGLEKKIASRLFFCAILLLILVYWIGVESILHPQLIDLYFLYFNYLFLFIYGFGFLWIITDSWKDAKFTVKKVNELDALSNVQLAPIKESVISQVKLKNFKIISVITLIIFFCFISLNVILSILAQFDRVAAIDYALPGTGIESSSPVNLSIAFYLGWISFPVLFIASSIIIFKDVIKYEEGNLNEILNDLPLDLRNEILHMLKGVRKSSNKE
jgi:hypothetical protein